MTEEQKQKFIELSRQTKEKGVPDGYVYVGFAPNYNGGSFSRLIALFCDLWSHGEYAGTSSLSEYAAPVSDWEAVIGPIQTMTPEEYCVNVGASPFLSEAVQKHAGKLGYEFAGGEPFPSFTDRKFLIFNLYGGGKLLVDDRNSRGLPELSLEKFFALDVKKLVLQGFGHEIIVTDRVKVGCQTISIENWKKLDKKINDFLASSVEFPEKFHVDVSASPLLSEAVQKHGFNLGYNWTYNKYEVQHTREPVLVFKKKSITFGGYSGYTPDGSKKLSLDEFFALNSPTLTIPAGLVPDYEVKVDTHVSCARKKVTLAEWKELSTKINQFLK